MKEYIHSLPVISSHNHHLPDSFFEGFGLARLLENSYTAWCAPFPAFGDTDACRSHLLRFGTNSFFRWLFAALEQLYGLPVTAENLPLIDEAVKQKYSACPSFHLDILKGACRMERIVNERQPDPGSDLGHPELFSPSFRCDCFFSAYLPDKPEPNGFFAYSLFDRDKIETVTELLDEMYAALAKKKSAGISALKVAIAYERPIDFKKPCLDKAQRAMNNPDASAEEIMAFGDAVMFGVAESAARLGLPLQIHTGTGQYHGTSPLGLMTLIEENPQTRFHLLHGGFPWLEDTYALLLRFPNVMSDICWIPYLSTSAAQEYILRSLEIEDCHRLTWGCDTWVSEDSLGALLAMEQALSEALEKMIKSGAADRAYAEYIARRIMSENARELFRLP